MYGLASREALSKRQSRWIREVDATVRSNPAQRALNQEPVSNIIRDGGSIISLMADPSLSKNGFSLVNDTELNTESNTSLASGHNPMLRKTPNKSFNSHLMSIIPDEPDETLETLHTLYTELKKNHDDLRQNYSKLEQECATLRRTITDTSDLSVRIDRIEQSQNSHRSFDSNDIVSRVQRLERTSDLTTLISRVNTLERSVHELSSLSISVPISTQNIQPAPTTPSGVTRQNHRLDENLSDFSALTEVDIESKREIKVNPSNTREFLPYFIKEDYAGRDNITKLKDLHLDMIVEILGFYSEPPVIYPFGQAQNLPKFCELTVDMSFKDADRIVDGTAYGVFKQQPDGIYTIELTELYSDGEASGIEKYTLPLTLTCKTDLLLE